MPIKMNECSIHPKLAPIQYLDFTFPDALPWDPSKEYVTLRQTSSQAPTSPQTNVSTSISTISDTTAKAILAFLNQHGYQMASFDRFASGSMKPTNKDFQEVIAKHPTVFRSATISGGLSGIAKLVPESPLP